jgi:hypothetical protein
MSQNQIFDGPAVRLFNHPYGPVPAPKWNLGLDLGERQDHSALAINDLEWKSLGRCYTTYGYKFAPILTVRSMERFPLSTGYQNIPLLIAERVRQINEHQRQRTPHVPANIELVVDAGGPGGPMVDMLRAMAPENLTITPVMITSGTGVTRLKGGYYGVPRRDLVTRLIQMIATGCLQCPAAMPNAAQWHNELLSLSRTNTHPGASGEHDDLTLAAALAAWAATRETPELSPAASTKKTIYGFIDKPIF